jgi:Tol biopolymer transport system component
MIRSFAALTLLLASTTALAAPSRPAARDANAWDVNAPPGATLRQVNINVNEGTWMNVDVSPDGRTIAFDLLGDIYTMPIAGGHPTRITSGLAFDMQPRFSPDGRQLAFTSDRGGGDNIWVMNADGSGARQITHENFRLLNAPTWSPDGQYIAARKHFTTQRSLGTGEIWLYHVSGVGDGVPLVERPNPQFQKELGEPAFSADGHAIYFSRNTTPGNTFQYAQDSNQEVFAIERYDMASGERTKIAGGPGGAVRPTPSPDGQWLAYVHRTGGHSHLFVKNLRSGEERQVYAGLDRDLQETWAVHGVYPDMAWTPDSNTIVFWAGGKIRRVNRDGSGAAEIPFQVSDTRVVIDPPHPTTEVAPATIATRMPRFASISPDGRQIVFETLGRLYIRDVAGGGAPRPLTAQDGDFQLFPSWSRDGRNIAFVSWNDQRLGEIRTISPDGSNLRTVTQQPGHYRRPHFSPDGGTIVYEASGSQGLTSNRWSADTGIFRVPAAGGASVRILGDGTNPQFGADGSRVFLEVNEEQKDKLISVDLNGGNRRVHAQGEMVTEYELSPDGRTLLFREDYNLFATPFYGGVHPLDVSARATGLPLTRITTNGGTYPSWTTNGRVAWSLGPTLYTAAASDLIRSAPGGTPYAPPAAGTSLSITVPADKPTGLVALVGARIVTMANAEGGIIDDGVILIAATGSRGRPARLGRDPGRRAHRRRQPARRSSPGSSTPMPTGRRARTISSRSRTGRRWSTSRWARPPSTIPRHGERDLRRLRDAAGRQDPRPRIFSTGEIIYGAASRDATPRSTYRRRAGACAPAEGAQGAHVVKNYNQPRREQRQMVVAAAQREGIEVVPEGGSLFTDGHHPHPGRRFDARAQYPAGALLRRRRPVLDPDQDQLHADPGRHLWRPRRRSLLAPAYGRVGTIRCSAGTRRRPSSPRRTCGG